MDYETKIYIEYIEKLIGALEEINSSEYPIIILTIINVVAFILTAICQIKLQKRQTKAQEFDIYRNLYSFISSSNEEIFVFLPYIYSAITSSQETNDRECFMRKCNDIIELRKNMSRNMLDYKLKFSKKFLNIDKYNEILSLMLYILKYMNNLYKSNLILPISEMKDVTDDDSYIEAILTQIEGSKKTECKEDLKKFVNLKRQIHQNEYILKEIHKRCKIN